MQSVEIKSSKLQGMGVYAVKNFKKGSVILVIDDTHVVTDHSKLTKYQLDYKTDLLAGGKVILMQPPEVYINHSCNPNTFVKTVSGVRNVIAIKEIKRGEEITYDYSINGSNDGTFECHCGSKNCRGVYQGNFFKLPKKLQIKYLPLLDSWFVEEHKGEIDRLKGL
jgi:SET domain-containing protein